LASKRLAASQGIELLHFHNARHVLQRQLIAAKNKGMSRYSNKNVRGESIVKFSVGKALLISISLCGWQSANATVSSSTSGCVASSSSSGSSSYSSSASSQACAFDARGLQTAVVSASTVSTALAISSAVSSAISGRLAPGVTRFSLNGSKPTGAAAAPGGERWNGWFSLAESRVGYSFQPLQSSGYTTMALAGVDYTFGNDVIVGVAASWDRTRIGTSFNGGDLSSNGYMVSPYLAVRLTSSWLLDASFGIGRADLKQTDNSFAGGLNGTSTDDRSFGTLSLSYAHVVGKWALTGRGTYLYTQDKISTSTLSNGFVVPSTSITLGQVRFGGQASYDAGVIRPYIGLYYFNDTQRANQAAVGGQTAANDRDGYTLQIGANFFSKGPVSGGVMYSTDQNRSQVKNDLWMANIGIRF